MIFYTHDGVVIADFLAYKPRNCFIMTQLKPGSSDELGSIRKELTAILSKRNIRELDATSYIQGTDFLDKIWKQLISIPMGIAIITESMGTSTFANIFYELGVLDALGKESIIIKSKNCHIPSDFIRTEYIEYGKNFRDKMNNFIDQVDSLATHYEIMGDALESDPILTIDYYKRAYLITGDSKYFRKIEGIMDKQKFDTHISRSINHFLSIEKIPDQGKASK